MSAEELPRKHHVLVVANETVVSSGLIDLLEEKAGEQPTHVTVVAPVTQPGGGRDLSTVSNEEMESVIAQNPNVIPMRLALAERYLGDGNFQKASEHAHVALQQNPGTTDKARALRDLGWVTALQGNASQGAGLLEQSLQIEPTDKNTVFFLARVRLDGNADAVRQLDTARRGV